MVCVEEGYVMCAHEGIVKSGEGIVVGRAQASAGAVEKEVRNKREALHWITKGYCKYIYEERLS
jgi:hypothetical protein